VQEKNIFFCFGINRSEPASRKPPGPGPRWGWASRKYYASGTWDESRWRRRGKPLSHRGPARAALLRCKPASTRRRPRGLLRLCTRRGVSKRGGNFKYRCESSEFGQPRNFKVFRKTAATLPPEYKYKREFQM
jgi:hypothetical protein